MTANEIVSLDTLEECRVAAIRLQGIKEIALGKYSKLLAGKKKATKLGIPFSHQAEFEDVTYEIASYDTGLLYLKDIKQRLFRQGSGDDLKYIEVVVRAKYGDQMMSDIWADVQRMKQADRDRPIQRPGLALEPRGQGGSMRVRIVEMNGRE